MYIFGGWGGVSGYGFIGIFLFKLLSNQEKLANECFAHSNLVLRTDLKRNFGIGPEQG